MLSLVVLRTQRGYYRATRDPVKRLEAALRLAPGQGLDTTAALAGRSQRIKVEHVITLLFLALVVAHGVGIVAVLR